MWTQQYTAPKILDEKDLQKLALEESSYLFLSFQKESQTFVQY